jgi:hypothetical protein
MVTMPRKTDLDDDDEVRDGESVRCEIFAMDSVQRGTLAKYGRHTFDATDHKPHHGELTPELRKLRQETRSDYVSALIDAWKTPGRVAKQDADPGETDPDRAGAVENQLEAERSPYEQHKAALANAWKTTRGWDLPIRKQEPPPPATIRTAAANMGGVAAAAAEVEAMRRRNLTEFSNQLENAWKFRVSYQ